jgi:hypothetical protein
VVITPHTAFPQNKGAVCSWSGTSGLGVLGALTGVDGLYCSGSFSASLFLSALAA